MYPFFEIWSGRSPGVGNGNSLQYSCLENSMAKKPGGLQSMRSQSFGHNWACTNTQKLLIHITEKWLVGSVTMKEEQMTFVVWFFQKSVSYVLLLLLSRSSRVWLLATPWTEAHQAPPSMGFSRQECWSGLPLPSPNVLYLAKRPHHQLCFAY